MTGQELRDQLLSAIGNECCHQPETPTSPDGDPCLRCYEITMAVLPIVQAEREGWMEEVQQALDHNDATCSAVAERDRLGHLLSCALQDVERLTEQLRLTNIDQANAETEAAGLREAIQAEGHQGTDRWWVDCSHGRACGLCRALAALGQDGQEASDET